MAGKNFIDWNGSNNLDPQDLVTGVAMDAAEDDDADAQQDKRSAPPIGSSGCMLSVLVIISVILNATFVIILL
jgi:hypothetical protein